MALSRLVFAPLLVLTLVIAACGGGGAATTAPGQATTAPGQATPAPTQVAASTNDDFEPGPAEPDATPGTSLTGCELVAPEDIEAALDLDAGTVDDGEFEETADILDPHSNQCRYTGDWGGLIVRVTPTDGVNTYDAVADVFGEDAEAIDGIGDGALWFEDNNRGYFISGSVMVLLQLTHISEGDFDSFREPTVALGEAAIAKI